MDKQKHKFRKNGKGWSCEYCGVVQHPTFYWYLGKAMKEQPSCPPKKSEVWPNG